MSCLTTFPPDVININTNDESPSNCSVIINHQLLMDRF